MKLILLFKLLLLFLFFFERLLLLLWWENCFGLDFKCILVFVRRLFLFFFFKIEDKRFLVFVVVCFLVFWFWGLLGWIFLDFFDLGNNFIVFVFESYNIKVCFIFDSFCIGIGAIGKLVLFLKDYLVFFVSLVMIISE